MIIEITCPEGHKLRVQENAVGKKARCPKCSTVFEVERVLAELEEPDEEEVPPEPIRSKKKHNKKAVEPQQLEEQENPSGNGVTLATGHLILLGGLWLGSVVLAGVLGAMFGGRGASSDVIDVVTQDSPQPRASQPSPNQPPANQQTQANSATQTSDSPPLGGNQQAASSPPATDLPGMEQVRKDIQTYLGYLDQKQFRMFVYELMPGERQSISRDSLQFDNPSDRTLEEIGQLRMHLESAAKSGTPTFNQDQTYVELKYVLAPSETVSNSPAPSVPALLTKPKGAVTGFGGNINKALTDASLVIDGDPQAFVLGMYPLAELARLEEGDNMARLLYKINNGRDMKARMIEDLRTCSHFASPGTMKLEEGGRVAVITVNPLGAGEPERVFKFEKVDGNWRIYDGAAKYREDSHRLASSEMKSIVVPGLKGFITLVKFENHWRLQGQPKVLRDESANSPTSDGSVVPAERAVPAARSF